MSPHRDVAQSRPAAAAPDKYLWLEDVSSPRAMAWVAGQNERTAKLLKSDPRYTIFEAAALAVLSDPARLAFPEFRDGGIDNFWRDGAHLRGIYRRTTVEDYLTDQPRWRTMLDIDTLNTVESAKWVFHGTNDLYPGDRHTLVNLADGGEDAVTVREFDLKSAKFVEGGFVLPRSKQTAAWVNKDTLLVSRDWSGLNPAGPSSPALTASGYPYIVKRWKRGTPLSSAEEVYRGTPADVSVRPYVMNDAQGNQLDFLIQQVSFFQSRLLVDTGHGFAPLGVPLKSNLRGMLNGRVLLEVREDWMPMRGGLIRAGSLVSLQLNQLRADPAHPRPEIIFAPTATEFLDSVATTKTRLLLLTLNNVQGRAYVYARGPRGWTHEPLRVPENTAVDIAATSHTDDRYALTIAGFITPPALWFGVATEPANFHQVKSQPALFDSSRLTVDQLFATSKDGTRVPYFVVHRKDWKTDGMNPTQLDAYGGFEVSSLPAYSAARGKLWLERGGVYVLANIRGGGEFGPAWHEAGLKTKRQVIYDDFAAVGQDLIRRGITTPRRLGIRGGSNGGLLMGVEMEQHPELWNAVVIQVPLLDMLRFEHIAAGASWVGEYGSVSVPEERAFLAGISPYANLKRDVTYPEPLIFTTTKDDRVGPQHARKFAALMAEYGKPYLYDEITEGGHGAGADLKQEAGTAAEIYVYLTRKLMD